MLKSFSAGKCRIKLPSALAVLMHVILILLTGIFSSQDIIAQITPYFRVYDMQSGLPSNSINDITEDEYGMIWIATWKGVARFDGKTFTVFQHDESKDETKASSLTNDMARSLACIPGGIWIGTDAGLDFFRFADCRFYHCRYIDDKGEKKPIDTRVNRLLYTGVTFFAVTSSGKLLRLSEPGISAVGSNGEPNDDMEAEPLFVQVKQPKGRAYTDLTLFSNGNILAASDDGISVLSPDCEKELTHNSLDIPFDLHTNIFWDKQCNCVYLGFGIGSTMRTFSVDNPEGKLTETAGVPIPGLMEIAADRESLYFATDGHGYYVSHSKDESPQKQIPSAEGSFSIRRSSDAIYSIFVDSRRNIWLGSYRHGLFMAPKNAETCALANTATGELSYDIVTAVVPVGDKLYLGLDGGGLDIYDPATATSRNINASGSALPGNNIVDLSTDNGKVWGIDYNGGLFEINTSTGAITAHPTEMPQADASARATLSDKAALTEKNRYWLIADDGNGRLWLGGTSILIYDKKADAFRRLPVSNVQTIADGGNYFWVGTRYNGILRVNKRTYDIERRITSGGDADELRLPADNVQFLFFDSHNTLWANVANKYLCAFNPDSDKAPRIFSVAEGSLGNANIVSMAEDSRGNLLIGTDNGLYKFTPASGTFVRRHDPRMPGTFTPHTAMAIGDKIYFGTTSGLLSISASPEQTPARDRRPLFTGLRILDGTHTLIPLYTPGDNVVTLDSDQNSFTISFSVSEISDADQVIFRCRMEGLDHVWREISGPGEISYTNVSPGEYTFEVCASNPDGTWTAPSRMTLRIRPPWYASIWMIIVWILLGMGIPGVLLLVWHKYNRNRQKARMIEVEKESAKRLHEAKLDFYTSITHELRTPCFLISAQIEEILESGRQSMPVSTLHGIYRNSSRLNKLINHILDFRKSDAGQLQLTPRRIELVKFLGSLTDDYEQLCRQKSLDFSFVHDAEPIEVTADPDKLEQIVSNLISNAFKYTPKGGGSITLTLHDLGDKVTISVTDTGIGILDQLQSTIFEPFYRTERGRSQDRGDGIGLHFVKQLVELHHGTITVDSVVNRGSTFTVMLPKNQDISSEPPVTGEIQPPLLDTDLHRDPIQQPNSTPSNPTATHSMLIVDDNPQVAAILSRVFENDYAVTTAPDGRVAYELAREGSFDVVITDLMMPEIDGLALLKMLRSNPVSRNVKVVILSAVATEEDMLKAYDLGVDAFLTKPTSLKILRMQIDNMLTSGSSNTGSQLPAAPDGSYNREEQKFLLRCRNIIDTHMTDENFSIDTLTAELAMSHSSLYKKIRRMTGMSLLDFINEYRIYTAVRLFRDGNSNVQRVAEMCGFRDIKTFRETFKRKMGMPPKQFILTFTVRNTIPISPQENNSQQN